MFSLLVLITTAAIGGTPGHRPRLHRASHHEKEFPFFKNDYIVVEEDAREPWRSMKAEFGHGIHTISGERALSSFVSLL